MDRGIASRKEVVQTEERFGVDGSLQTLGNRREGDRFRQSLGRCHLVDANVGYSGDIRPARFERQRPNEHDHNDGKDDANHPQH